MDLRSVAIYLPLLIILPAYSLRCRTAASEDVFSDFHRRGTLFPDRMDDYDSPVKEVGLALVVTDSLHAFWPKPPLLSTYAYLQPSEPYGGSAPIHIT